MKLDAGGGFAKLVAVIESGFLSARANRNQQNEQAYFQHRALASY